MIEGLYSDRDAKYAEVIELDAAEITPMVATPGDPGNGKYIRELHTPVPVEIAYGGTCTAGKNEDMDMYAAVLADALKQGKRVADSVKFYIQFGSQETREYCIRQGLSRDFSEGRGDRDRAELRSLHQRRAGRLNAARPDCDQRAKPKFPRPQRPGPDVSGFSAHCRCERGGRIYRGIPAERRETTRGRLRQVARANREPSGCVQDGCGIRSNS